MKQLLLASGSPRRKELLEQVGIPFSVQSPNVDETLVKETDPQKLVERLAQIKGEALHIGDFDVVLSADTVVSFDGEVLTKPLHQEDALNMLSKLNGSKHTVYTGVMIKSKEKQKIFSVATNVQFWDVTHEELQAYVASGDSLDKAGGYGIQSNGAFLVKEIAGDYFNVVGLPISTVVRYLREFDIYPA